MTSRLGQLSLFLKMVKNKVKGVPLGHLLKLPIFVG